MSTSLLILHWPHNRGNANTGLHAIVIDMIFHFIRYFSFQGLSKIFKEEQQSLLDCSATDLKKCVHYVKTVFLLQNHKGLFYQDRPWNPGMVSEEEMWIGPEIWVPPGIADYLFSRMQWIKEGEQGNFQVGVPYGYDFEDLATLAHLIVTDDLGPAKVLAENLPRSITWMDPSSTSLVEGNANYTLKNPFKRRRGKARRRNRNGAAENSVQVENCIIFSLPQCRGVYSSLFRYNHTNKKLPFLAEFIKN